MQELSRKAAQEKRPLKEVLLGEPAREMRNWAPPAIEKLFMPLTYQGSAQTFIDRLVVASQMRAPRRAELVRSADGRPAGTGRRRRCAGTKAEMPAASPAGRAELPTAPQFPTALRPGLRIRQRPKLPIAPTSSSCRIVPPVRPAAEAVAETAAPLRR